MGDMTVATAQIRNAKPEDKATLIDIQTQALRHLPSAYSPLQIEALVRSQGQARAASDELGWVVEVEGAIAGFATMLPYPSTIMGGMTQISGVYVVPARMGRGLGRQLLTELERQALDQGLHTAHVWSSIDTVAFYQACGYTVVRQAGFYCDSTIWIPCVYLQKRLAPVSWPVRVRWFVQTAATVLTPVGRWLLWMAIAFLVSMLIPVVINLLINLLG